MKLTKYNRKLKWTFIKTALAVSFAMVVAYPWFSSLSTTKEGYYKVVLNGEELGAVGDPSIVDEAYLAARLDIEHENEASVYIDYDLQVYEEDKLYGRKLSADELKEKMYSLLTESSVEVKEKAYIVDIEGMSITLGSREDVVALLNAAKHKYDEDNQFATILTDGLDSRFSYISYEFINLNTEIKNNAIVMASEGSEATPLAEEPVGSDGVRNISFDEEVEIIEAYVSKSQITPLSEAIEQVTKENEESKIYEVKSGDTLSGIAASYNLTLDELLNMNPDIKESMKIFPGDRVNVTVPEPALSVVLEERKTYEESYNLPVRYVYNDSQYTTYSKVLNEGSEGYREVVADISYINGVETGRKIIKEKVIQEPVERVVEVGTITPPTFIYPMSSGRLSSGFGPRWGRLHGGVDWAVSTGTSVWASCGGTVTQAGWFSTYGYCVTITHGNGMQTRYAHLSKVLVSVGQYVKQGEVIGRSGNTGNSTGPHLHFEIIVNGVRVNPFNYLK